VTHEDRFIGQLERYFDEYEGITPLPDTVRDAVRATIPTTPQTGSDQGPMRFLNMTRSVPAPVRYGLVAVAVFAAAVLGAIFYQGINVGAPTDPTPTPRPALPLAGDSLESGTYRLRAAGGITVSLTVPAGWRNVSSVGVWDGPPTHSERSLVFWNPNQVQQVYADPCRSDDGFVDVSDPTVDELAEALANQPDRGEAIPEDIVIDSFTGKQILLQVPEQIDFADCDGGEFSSWFGRSHQLPGQVDRVYILDVDGQVLVIDMSWMSLENNTDRAELQAIVDSITIEPPG
jgi:hypothetical protein